MDDLMRKAAEAFEVSPVGADWQNLEARLNAVDVPVKNNTAKAQGIRFGFLLLFLFISLVCNKYLFFHTGTRVAKTVESASEFIPKDEKESKMETIDKSGNKNLEPVMTNGKKGSENVSISFYKIENNTKTEKEIQKNAFRNDAVIQMERKAIVHNRTIKRFQTHLEPKHVDLGEMNSKTFSIPFVNAEPYIKDLEKNRQQKSVAKRKKGRFYLGVIAGPDLSTVKNEKSDEWGYTIGLVGGYQLNKKWAVETGLLWDRKNYYATGRHFNTSKMNLPSHTNIIYAEGYCHMWEIPLNVRYNIGYNKKHQWFAVAGISSYLMQKEAYHYLYERYNVEYYGSKNYKAASRNWLSVANIGAGYQYSTNKGINIRVEPYLKLPLTGLGIGSLPITSTGVQLGVTYPIQ